MKALLFGAEPDKWEGAGDKGPLTAWPTSANAQVVLDNILPGAPWVLFDHKSKLVLEMGVVPFVGDVGPDVGWTEGEDYEAAGWKVDPARTSRTFTREGWWLPLIPIGLYDVGITFPLPQVAIQERLADKLYRRNPVIISANAYRAVQLAADKAIRAWGGKNP